MHKDCYGQMFPNEADLQSDQDAKGKVFSSHVKKKGLSIPEKTAHVNIEEWDDCLTCSEFDSCYKMSTGKMAILNAIR